MGYKHHPVCLVLTRQNVPTLDRTKYAAASGVSKGAYVLADADGGPPEVILLATGSEVSMAVDAYERLKKDGVKARVVSMPSWEVFEEQDDNYKRQVLPPEVSARVSVELASTFGWARYVGTNGVSIGMKGFGASAPLKDLQKKFNFSVEGIVNAAKDQVAKHKAKETMSQVPVRGMEIHV